MSNFASLSCSITYTPEQVYADVLAFDKDRTLEGLIPNDQIVIDFRPVREGEWHLRTFGVPGIAEIDIAEPRLILFDRSKGLPPESAQLLLKFLADGFSLGDILKFIDEGDAFTRADAGAYLKALAAKEAQCTK